MNRLFCFGLGYSADGLAARLRAAGWSVAGTTRSAAKRDALAARDLQLQQQRAGLPAGFRRFVSGGRRLVAQAAQVRVAGGWIGV